LNRRAARRRWGAADGNSMLNARPLRGRAQI
jgi:hypothetical protein